MSRAAKNNKSPLIATALVLGLSPLFLAVPPATAAPLSCASGGVLIAPGICELTFTESGTFTPTADMHRMEVLLVAGGGWGSAGYGAGGGGEVKVVGFAGNLTDVVTVTVGQQAQVTEISQGSWSPYANRGFSGSSESQPFGLSGTSNGNMYSLGLPASGGGSGAPATSRFDGGPGTAVSSLVSTSSVFASETSCFGGGGAFGDTTTRGSATCGGGTFDPDAPTLTAIKAVPGSGGGGAGTADTTQGASMAGASGRAVFRWVPPAVSVTFDNGGQGAVIPPATIPLGGQATPPANPSAPGYTFNGWFADAQLTAPAVFSAPIMEGTTFYASWTAVIAPTVTVSFDNNGRGAAIPPQSVSVGDLLAAPAAPTAAGFTFNGWFRDSGLTTPAVFPAEITEATTFYASWTAVTAPDVVKDDAPAAGALASTGGEPLSAAASFGVGALAVGLGLIGLASRRRRRA